MDDKPPFSALEERLTVAAQAVPVGSHWRHYKGGEYVIAGHAIIEATNEVAIIYTSLAHPAVTFMRPLTVWNEQVEWGGQTLPRFHPMD